MWLYFCCTIYVTESKEQSLLNFSKKFQDVKVLYVTLFLLVGMDKIRDDLEKIQQGMISKHPKFSKLICIKCKRQNNVNSRHLYLKGLCLKQERQRCSITSQKLTSPHRWCYCEISCLKIQ